MPASQLHGSAVDTGRCRCPQGDELLVGLCEAPMLRSENFHTLRLVGVGLTDDGVTRLAKTIESVGEQCTAPGRQCRGACKHRQKTAAAS